MKVISKVVIIVATGRFNFFSSTKYATGTSSQEMEEVKAANVSKMKNRIAHS